MILLKLVKIGRDKLLNVSATRNGKTASANLHPDGEINVVEVHGKDRWTEKYNGRNKKEAGSKFNEVLGKDKRNG